MTADFHHVTGDRHLRLQWSDEAHDADRTSDDFAAACVAQNHGVHRVERLEGNIGCIDLRLITLPAHGAAAIAAAMELVSRTSALILDLRRNRGGDPAGVQHWCSYFFAGGDVHLNDIYVRATDSTRQYWTLHALPGPRYLDRPVYVLTSAETFSGGEELAYNLKALERAVLVGETTRGGAHPCEWYALTPHIAVTVPVARSINPVTGTNWEGTGVTPDVATSADAAFDVAYEAARAAITR